MAHAPVKFADEPPPSLPPLVKYVLAPGAVGLLWLAFGTAGFLLALFAWLGWYVYEGYAEATRQ